MLVKFLVSLYNTRECSKPACLLVFITLPCHRLVCVVFTYLCQVIYVNESWQELLNNG